MKLKLLVLSLIGMIMFACMQAQTRNTSPASANRSSAARASVGTSKPFIDADSLFSAARTLAFGGQRETARTLLKNLTAKFPLYYDAYVLTGRTYAWDGEYEKAHEEFDKVIFLNGDFKDAYLAKLDTYIWESKPDSAISFSERALVVFPDDADILTKKAKALAGVGKKLEAEKLVSTVLKSDSSNFEAKTLYASIANISKAVAFEYLVEVFDAPLDKSFHVASLEYIYKSSFGAIIPRVNIRDVAEKGELPFSKDMGVQFELDAYPRISKYNTLYLNAGFSSSSLFPRTRLGLELYQKLGTQAEISLGVRSLNYRFETNGVQTNENIVFYTGSFSLYKEKWFASYRPFVKFNAQGNAISNVFLVRRYLAQPYKYFSFQYVTGQTPDEFALVTTSFDVDKLKSNRYRVGISWPLNEKWVGAFDLGYYDEQVAQNVDVKAYMGWIRLIRILK